MAAGPHPPFVLVSVLCPRSLARWTGSDEGAGHLGSHAERSPRSLCAGALAPRRSTPRPPPRRPRPARARANPQPHTRSRAPQVELPPRALRGPCAPAPGPTSPACPAGTRRPSMKPPAGLCGPLPAPPPRQRQVRVHNCQARPQPPPSGFPAPRDYRSCGGSVSARRPRPGGGAGQVTRASLPPGRTAGEGPAPLPWQPPARVLATGENSSFSPLCPSEGRSPLGHLVARLWSVRLAHLHCLFKDSGRENWTGHHRRFPWHRARGFAQAAPAWGCCGASAHQGHRSHGNPVHPARTRMEHEWPATVNPARPSIPTTKIRSCSLSGAAGRAQVAVGTSGSFTLGNAQQPVWRLRGQVQACGDDSPTSRWPWLSKGTPSWSFQTSAISCPFMLSTKTSFELYNYFKNTFKISPIRRK